MKKPKIDRITEKLIGEDIFNEDGKLTQEELDFLKTNPRLLAKLTDTNYIKRKYIIVLFSISVLMAVIAKGLEYTELLSGYRVLNDLFTEVLFAIAMEMLGASIIAYFLEILLENRMRKNNHLMQQLIAKQTKDEENDIGIS